LLWLTLVLWFLTWFLFLRLMGRGYCMRWRRMQLGI